ncbi:MAG TPA: BtpA/SgcQ family protein [Xanthomonadales bacterium]|nr:BtpA/SgcQ family protein [Xanthomonadales bacterium]
MNEFTNKELPAKALIAMIALRALPGAPLYDGDDQRIIDAALSDLDHYKRAGVDAVLLENDFDLPYAKGPMSPEAVKVAKEVCDAVRAEWSGPMGLQFLEAANEDALVVANDCGLDFIRVEGFVYAHVGGAGFIDACAGSLLRKRAELGCTHIRVFPDINKKHCAHAMTADLDIALEARQAELFMADGLVVTGKFTGESADTSDLEMVRKATTLPILIGSGMTPENVDQMVPMADAFIVGSTFRNDGQYLEKLNPGRLQRFVDAFNAARS